MSCEKRMLTARSAIFSGAFLVLFATGCAPAFPNCKTDAHCAAFDGNGGRLFCVNGTCQECAANADCGTEKVCVMNRCDAKPQCTADADCNGGMVCRQQKCRLECAAAADCGQNMSCENARCVVQQTCRTDQDCSGKKRCQKGVCMQLSAAKDCEIQPIHFDFDRYEVTTDNKAILAQNAECIAKRGVKQVVVEGNTDERGTTEYNINLGFSRANAVKQYIEIRGVKSVKDVSYGEERPVCREATEACWQTNRRDDFVLK